MGGKGGNSTFLNVSPYLVTSRLKGLRKRKIIAKTRDLYLNPIKNGGHSKFQQIVFKMAVIFCFLGNVNVKTINKIMNIVGNR